MRVAVLTVDQRASRSGPDLVPGILAALASFAALRPFERTAGDEVQGVVDDPAALPAMIEKLLREDAWKIGIGIGDAEEPLATSTRAGRGTAFVRARSAVIAAKRAPWHLTVVGEPDDGAARSLETTLWLWAAVLGRRTERGWAVADLVGTGMSYDEVGRRLGITQSAVSQRAQAAGIVESRRARELAERLTADLLGKG